MGCPLSNDVSHALGHLIGRILQLPPGDVLNDETRREYFGISHSIELELIAIETMGLPTIALNDDVAVDHEKVDLEADHDRVKLNGR